MENFIDYYELLGVSYESSAAEIKTKFRQLSKTSHPDLNPDSIFDFRQILDAYKTLSDSETRRIYDISLKKYMHQKQIQETNAQSRFFIVPEIRMEYNTSYPADHDILVKVHPLEVKMGAAIRLQVPARKRCPVCGGLDYSCYRCGGLRTIRIIEEVTYRIPRNIQNHEIIEICPADFLPEDSFRSDQKTWKIRFIWIE